jgi:hypothetical protein
MRSANRSDLRCPAQKSPYHTKGRDKKKNCLSRGRGNFFFLEKKHLAKINVRQAPPPEPGAYAGGSYARVRGRCRGSEVDITVSNHTVGARGGRF